MASQRISRGFHWPILALALCCVGGTTKANPTEPFPTFTDGNELFDACEGFRRYFGLVKDGLARFDGEKR
jgi:hypothetical protein